MQVTIDADELCALKSAAMQHRKNYMNALNNLQNYEQEVGELRRENEKLREAANSDANREYILALEERLAKCRLELEQYKEALRVISKRHDEMIYTLRNVRETIGAVPYYLCAERRLGELGLPHA